MNQSDIKGWATEIHKDVPSVAQRYAARPGDCQTVASGNGYRFRNGGLTRTEAAIAPSRADEKRRQP